MVRDYGYWVGKQIKVKVFKSQFRNFLGHKPVFFKMLNVLVKILIVFE